MSKIIFDIETGPLPIEQIRQVLPPFDPSSVKCGNIKDEAKIAEKIDAARREYEADMIDKAALDPLTGQVLAIGYHFCHEEEIECHIADEVELLESFWTCVGSIDTLVGHNIHGFDLPFLTCRSRLLGVPVPKGLIENGRYWSHRFVDTMQIWAAGRYQCYTGLGKLARAFGVGDKNGDGANFAELLKRDRDAAIAYLTNDLQLTFDVAKKLGAV